jgi:CMP/dCMP kinase
VYGLSRRARDEPCPGYRGRVLIAIDGPAGAGKSTVARAVAHALGCGYLDSGAMYRCVALLSLEQPDCAPAVLASAATITLSRSGDGWLVQLDGRDVTAAIRAPAVSAAASRLAADPGVREALVAKQRALIAHGDWVAEGRDIGTVVAPDADLKIYLTATPAERADRRARELGIDATGVLAAQDARDLRDSTRKHSPLTVAPDAIELDTSGLDVDAVVARIIALAQPPG